MKQRKRSFPVTAEWQRYWSDDKAPHPDADRPLSSERVLAPFRGGSGPSRRERLDSRESFYCHHYRQAGEHYHKTFEELEGCER